MEKHIVLGSRLEMALSLIGSTDTFADIGSDHGRLCCALLQRGMANHCIAADISADSLKKAVLLSEKCGLSDCFSFRVGNGLSVLQPKEADTIAVLGMGGNLIVDILSGADVPLNGARRALLQPMRGQEVLRKYLFENGYHILQDVVVEEEKRLYQLILVEFQPDLMDEMPDDFPPECFTVGYHAFSQRDPLTKKWVERELEQARKGLSTAAGSRGEAVLRIKETQMLKIISNWEMS